MSSLDEILAALTGRRPVAQDDPLRGYTPPSDPLAAPPPYAPSPWEAAAMRQRNAVRPPAGRQEGNLSQGFPSPGDLAKTGQEFHAGDVAFREALPGKIAQGVLAMPHVMADLPRAVVNTSLVQPIKKGAELMSRANAGEDVTTNPQDVGEAFGAANVAMGGAAPFASKGALGAAGGKLVIPAAERTVGTTSAPFYSAVDSALSNAKLEKAPLDQWHNYLKTQPNIKAEELNQLGLNPSSSGFSPGSLTKAQLQEHLDANRVQLKEVNKGDRPLLDETEQNELAALKKRFATGDMTLMAEDAQRAAELKMRQERLPQAFDAPKFGPNQHPNLSLPGASNYGEMLLTLPPKENPYPKFTGDENNEVSFLRPRLGNLSEQELARYNELMDKARKYYGHEDAQDKSQYKSSHWDEPNVLVHVRHNDRPVPAPNGEGTVPSLHLEEVQSDLHQQGRKEGYKDELPEGWSIKEIKNGPERYGVKDYYQLVNPKGEPGKIGLDKNALVERANLSDRPRAVPGFPFKDTWPDLALKRMLHKAATETNADGTPKYHALSWTPGEAQAARYDLSKHVNKLQYDPEAETLGIWEKKQAEGVGPSQLLKVEPEKLSDHVGKDIAEKLLKADKNPNGRHELSGLDLKVGGSGMKEFYDKMLVNKANALGKKFGARVGQSGVDQPGGIGQWTYKGPDLSSHEILAAADKANSVSIERQLRDIAESVKRHGEGSPEGLPLKDAVEKHGSYAAAEALGGELTNAAKKQPVHVLPITPELRQAAARGFPLFSMGLALPGAAPLDDRAAKALATKPPDVGQYR